MERHDASSEPRQIPRTALTDQRRIGLELVCQGDHIGNGARAQRSAHGVEDSAMQRIGEMIGPDDLRGGVPELVAHEQGPQERHLGLVVGKAFGRFLPRVHDTRCHTSCRPSAAILAATSGHAARVIFHFSR